LKFSLEFGSRNQGKDASRKGAKRAKFGEIFPPLRPWRLGAINFLEVVLFNISKARIYAFPLLTGRHSPHARGRAGT
jgi:hypothetical protein